MAQFNLPPPASYPVPRSPAALIAVDLDGDMPIDFATCDQGAGVAPDRISVLFNNGDGHADLIVARPGPFLDSDGQADCNVTVPTVSQWGLVVMVLLLVTAARAICRNRFHPFPNH